ncbi:MAG: hypothetical protein IRZ11_08340 [Clostridia bacterium]|nr:hypothetical protein [Clostridia bacterium]
MPTADLGALAALLGGYTNAAEQCAGVPPGARDEAMAADEAAWHEAPGLTLAIARELVRDAPKEGPGAGGGKGERGA